MRGSGGVKGEGMEKRDREGVIGIKQWVIGEMGTGLKDEGGWRLWVG